MNSLITRSTCPISNTLDVFGDKWSLLIVRDLFIGRKTYTEMLGAPEKIATNILVSRLKKLIDMEIVDFHKVKGDGKTKHYYPTDKGIDLFPLMLQMSLWKRKHMSELETHPLGLELFEKIDRRGVSDLYQKVAAHQRSQREELLSH